VKSISLLKSEHRLILEQLDNLSRARQGLEEGSRPPGEFFESAVVFAREFADRFHHFKEEFLLFGMLARNQEGRLDAEIGALRYQHERCREAMATIEQALPAYGSGDEIAATLLAMGLSVYVTLLRRHIFLEDDVFFPLAAKMLTDEDDAELLKHFAEAQEQPSGRDFMADWRRQVAAMGALLRRGTNPGTQR
jgi:hemerythrin-like domain-containing protein